MAGTGRPPLLDDTASERVTTSVTPATRQRLETVRGTGEPIASTVRRVLEEGLARLEDGSAA